MLNFEIQRLYSIEGISDLDDKFEKFRKHSEDIFEIAFDLSVFVAELFEIDLSGKSAKYEELKTIYSCKRNFVQRYALKQSSQIALDIKYLEFRLSEIIGRNFKSEYEYSIKVLEWIKDPTMYQENINIAAQYARLRHGEEGSILYSTPKKLDYSNLIEMEKDMDSFVSKKIRPRTGFCLTDSGLSDSKAFDNASYCIYCHKRNKDSCRKGFKKKNGEYQVSELGLEMKGCPLGQKISEMNFLKSQGNDIGALAMIMLDNPMCLATGYRICNDCSKSCIFQKQDPVNIPGVESNIVSTVLSMPYGFEIYSLFTRWNPLNRESPILIKKESSKKVLVVGMGPSGFTLSHYLLNEGHMVVGIDGFKIEPIEPSICGVSPDGSRHEFVPIKYLDDETIEDRTIFGFGGVMEYGITPRWNKLYLKYIYILLLRNQRFSLHGGVRFGSNITYEDSVKMGFHHIALCSGAGSPKILDIENSMAKGVRMASDFLMSLQMCGAYKLSSEVNLQIMLPVVVIGGGLTAIDSATEALAYYPIQALKFLQKYDSIVESGIDNPIDLILGDENKKNALRLIADGKIIRSFNGDRELIYKYVRSLGGVKIVYRKRIQDSPAYKLNHDELESALSEGIEFCENYKPIKIVTKDRAVLGLDVLKGEDNFFFPAKTILVAIGTHSSGLIEELTNNAF